MLASSPRDPKSPQAATICSSSSSRLMSPGDQIFYLLKAYIAPSTAQGHLRPFSSNKNKNPQRSKTSSAEEARRTGANGVQRGATTTGIIYSLVERPYTCSTHRQNNLRICTITRYQKSRHFRYKMHNDIFLIPKLTDTQLRVPSPTFTPATCILMSDTLN